MKKLYIISGPDRVGKSTFQRDLSQALSVVKSLPPEVEHFSEPPLSQRDITERYRVSIDKFISSPSEVLIWDRSYVCAYILERFRKNSHSYVGDLVSFEVFLARKSELKVEHVGLTLPWHEIALFHLKELEETGLHQNSWSISGELISRMNEHRFYTEEMVDFYQNITMFPSSLLASREEVYTYLENIIHNGN